MELKSTADHLADPDEVDLEEASAHESGHSTVAIDEGGTIEWARVKAQGSGKTKIKDLPSLSPRSRALIAVAGNVGEEGLADCPRRPLGQIDRDQLTAALKELPECWEERCRSLAAEIIKRERAPALAIAARLRSTPNVTVSGTVLHKVMKDANSKTEDNGDSARQRLFESERAAVTRSDSGVTNAYDNPAGVLWMITS
jgi:hypothetical protein